MNSILDPIYNKTVVRIQNSAYECSNFPSILEVKTIPDNLNFKRARAIKDINGWYMGVVPHTRNEESAVVEVFKHSPYSKSYEGVVEQLRRRNESSRLAEMSGCD